MSQSRHKRLQHVAVMLGYIVVCAPLQGDVIRVDLQNNTAFVGRSAVNFTGVEAQASAANSLFGSSGANVWNELGLPASVANMSPSFGNLVNSAGLPTSVGISFGGTVYAANDVPINNTGSNAVENDYFLILTDPVTYTISGLPANTQVALYLYSPNFVLFDSPNPIGQPSRGYNLTANGTLITVPSGPNDNTLAFVTTSMTGNISGSWSTNGNEGDWSGFQIAYSVPATVPEPASFMLIIGTCLLLCGWRLSEKRVFTS